MLTPSHRLEGEPCGMRQPFEATVSWSYDSPAKGGLHHAHYPGRVANRIVLLKWTSRAAAPVFAIMLCGSIAADNVEAFDEEKAKALMDEKAKLQIQLDRIADTKQKRKNAKSRLDEIFTIIEALANHPISYDDQIVRQILESVIVESKEKIKVVFVGGLEVTQTM